MGQLGAFLKIERAEPLERDPEGARARLREFVAPAAAASSCANQGARCMECGVPFCHHGCPLGNLIPDWNDLVYRDRWREAIDPAAPDEQLPRVHRPPLPGAVRGRLRARDPRGRRRHDQADRALDRRSRLGGGLDRAAARRHAHRPHGGRRSAPARPGSPARSSCARLGHAVTVLERDESGGGLVRFGVPEFKIEKRIVERRLDQLAAEGVELRFGVDVGRRHRR